MPELGYRNRMHARGGRPHEYLDLSIRPKRYFRMVPVPGRADLNEPRPLIESEVGSQNGYFRAGGSESRIERADDRGIADQRNTVCCYIVELIRFGDHLVRIHNRPQFIIMI